MKPTIQFEDFEKLELRVGKVVAAIAPEWSNKLLQFTVNFGSELGERTILSGIRQWYKPEDLLNKNYPFIVNLAERKMGEAVSQGMMLMVDTFVNGENQPTVVVLPDSIEPGTVLR